MTRNEDILEALVDAIRSCRKDEIIRSVNLAVDSGIGPARIISEGFAQGVQELSMLFDQGKLFLPNLIIAVDAMQAGMDILDGAGKTYIGLGVIVNGTVEGDIHDIGKTLVSGMLRASGYIVYDLGCNVPLQDFIDKAKETGAHIISLSALTTISLSKQQELITMLKEQGFRNNVMVMVGGAPASQEWADRIGADCYAENAVEAVEKVKALIKVNQ